MIEYNIIDVHMHKSLNFVCTGMLDVSFHLIYLLLLY